MKLQKEANVLTTSEAAEILGDGADETEWLMVVDLADDGIRTATPDDVGAVLFRRT